MGAILSKLAFYFDMIIYRSEQYAGRLEGGIQEI